MQLSVTSADIEKRKEFLKHCAASTQEIHWPIIDPSKTYGALNPAGLGDRDKFSADGPRDQSTVGFLSFGDYLERAEKGLGYYSGAPEYGVVGTPATARVEAKLTGLYPGAAGAQLLPSGLNAIATLLQTFPPSPTQTILMPEGAYSPATRILGNSPLFQHAETRYMPYPSHADGAQLRGMLRELETRGDATPSILYIEAPISKSFEIPEIDELVEVAKGNKILTVMDNAWANHTGFNPIAHGVDLVILAGTKYESGYADNPSGIIIAGTEELHKKIKKTVRTMGNGAVSSEKANLLYHRLDSVKKRMEHHHASALTLTAWFKKQSFVKEILAPYLPDSPDHARFNKYFKQGNGLFTLVFNETVTQEQVEALFTHAPLNITGESWGGHVTLSLPANNEETYSKKNFNRAVRISTGLEAPEDLIASYAIGAQVAGLRLS